MSLNQAAFTEEDHPIAASSRTPPAPDPQYCDPCHRWLSWICNECDQPAHLICGGSMYFIAVNHDDCQLGLGWTPAEHGCPELAAWARACLREGR